MGSQRRGYEAQMAQAAKVQADIAKEGWEIYQPYMKYLLGITKEQLDQGFGQAPKFVREAFQKMEGQMSDEYKRAEMVGAKTLEQQWLQQGMDSYISAPAKASIMAQRQTSLAEDYARGLAQLKMQEAQIGINTSMQLASMLAGQAGTGASVAMGAGGQAQEILRYLHQYGSGNPWGNAFAGAASGAMGGYRTTGTWQGAAIGGILGAIGGYYS